MDAARTTPPVPLRQSDSAASDAAGPPPEPTPRAMPVMEQTIEINAANPDCLLFYRMGDFYELLFEGAEVASRALGVVLTNGVGRISAA